MPLRFYRRMSLIPGIRLNLSRSGPSMSFGVRGAHVTVGNRRGTRYSVGIPGSGLGWYKTVSKHEIAAPSTAAEQGHAVAASPAASSNLRWLLLPLQLLWFLIHATLWIALHLVEVALFIAAGLLMVTLGVAVSGGRRRRGGW